MFPNTNYHIRRLKSDERGIALVLSVLILANLLMITFVVTDIVMRIGKSSQQISESEIAYFAAESAVEKAIYNIEHNQDATSLGTSSASPLLGSFTATQGNWEIYLEPVYTLRTTCIDDAQKVIFPADQAAHPDKTCLYTLNPQNPIEKNANPLYVRLKPGKSFELDLNIATPALVTYAPYGTTFYPADFSVDWPGNPSGKVIVLSAQEQFPTVNTQNTNSSGKIPSSGTLGDAPDYRIRILNEDSSDITYEIAPGSGSDYLPVGIKVISRGYYSDDKTKERIIQIQRNNWSIY